MFCKLLITLVVLVVTSLPILASDTPPVVLWSSDIMFYAYPNGIDYDNDGDPLLGTQASFSIAWDRRWIFIETSQGQVEAHDMDTGERIWTAESGGRVLGSDQEYVYVSPNPQNIDALSIETGLVSWQSSIEIPDDVSGIPLIEGSLTSHQDTISVPFNFDGQRHIVDILKGTGEVLGWVPDAFFLRWGIDASIFGRSDELIGIQPSDVWQRTLSDVDAYPVNCTWGLVYQEGEDRATLSGIDLIDGTTLWTQNLGQHINSILCNRYEQSQNTAFSDSGLTITNYGQVYVITDPGVGSNFVLHAISIDTGGILWSVDNLETWLGENEYLPGYRFLGSSSDLVLFSHDGLTEAYSAADHSSLWQNAEIVLARYYGQTGNILIGEIETDSATREFVALDALTGNVLWASSLSAEEQLSLNVVGDYVVINDDGLTSFMNPDTGAVLLQLPLGDSPGYWQVGSQTFLVLSHSGENQGTFTVLSGPRSE
ncbi:MAG: PQQ-binding-like beta-propeller repeat protein [Burkholderiales bacterium]|nr:PQQ-binding-like beta-propeller repeat protein [Anaerolineae bacterium]